MRAFHQQAGGESNDSGHSLLDLQRSIIRAVKAMPGNQVCADCGSTNGMFLRKQLFSQGTVQLDLTLPSKPVKNYFLLTFPFLIRVLYCTYIEYRFADMR